MATWTELWNRPPTPAGWKNTANGFHLACYDSNRLGKKDMMWAESDNVVGTTGNTCRMSIRSQLGGVGFGVSVSWKFWFKFPVAPADGIRFWMMSRDEDVSRLTTQGYEISIYSDSNMYLTRLDGAGGATVIGTVAYVIDTNDHSVEITREVSGANRFWRVYFDGNLVIGPTNDSTYSVGTYMGIAADERMCVGPIVVQW